MTISRIPASVKFEDGDQNYVQDLGTTLAKINELVDFNNQVKEDVNEVLDLRDTLLAAAGGDVVTSADLEAVRKTAIAGGAGWL